MIQSWQFNLIGLLVLFFWCFRSIKYSLFWMYLWQLKNYHMGRFAAHFETDNGKKIFFNYAFLIKIFLFLLSFSLLLYEKIDNFSFSFLPEYINSPIWIIFGMTGSFIAIEGGLALRSILSGKLLKPEMTSKAMFLSLPVFAIPIITAVTVLIYLFNSIVNYSAFDTSSILFYLFLLLSVDILTPVISSFFILLFQPFTVAIRNKTLYKAAFKMEGLKDLLVIGITGSYGKSSTKEFLKIILSESFKVVSTLKNQNSEIGISECILSEVNDSHEVFICEMGAYNKGGIKLLCDIARPKIGILPAIGNQHLSTFGSQKNIIDGKFELIESLPKEGLAVLNWDNEHIREGYKGGVATIKCSLKKKEDVWAEGIKFVDQGLVFDACFQNGERIRIETGILGEYNISNLLLCIGVAKKIGMSKEEIANGCKRITPEISGMGIKDTTHGFSAIDSSYSANKVGVMAHLDYFKNIKRGGKKVIVMPCIIELGKEGKQTHYELGRKMADSCDAVIITNRDYFDDLKRGAIDNGMDGKNISCIENPLECFKVLGEIAQGGLVLFEGRCPSILIRKVFEK
ncbi:MAG: UDP-N-acetylmuramoyl-tripeptide--D-alanyl-D-alanine ligase [Candidatus Pacebacteria bacterium]|nr:UDP-N-acetylmuramoyl-tripeptide--D-alanyl-D-alanine ligase [Candidatus Paceibacterota bacterium]